MPFWGDGRDSHYRILVRRGERRQRADLYAFSVRDPIPRFPLPLQKGDAEPVVDLKPLLDELYDEASYDLRVDYTQPRPHRCPAPMPGGPARYCGSRYSNSVTTDSDLNPM
ncbi:MAG: DUF4058 family protein [Anaerolineae bacterium]